MTPSSPAPSNCRSQSSARSRCACHRREIERRLRGLRACASSIARRSPCGSAMTFLPFTASRSKATNDAGDSFASLAILDAAGCRRSCSASKSRPRGVTMTISPSTTQPAGSNAQQRLVQLGKVAIERLRVAALDVDVVAAAKDDRAEAVPFGLEEIVAFRRQALGDPGQHGLDGRCDGEGHGASAVGCPDYRARLRRVSDAAVRRPDAVAHPEPAKRKLVRGKRTCDP